MHITLGLHLDSHLGPSRKDTLGEPVLGRMGLLGLLETYLGLSHPEATLARRVTSYLGHLSKHADQPCFYSRSLEADSVGTSAKLLEWRDEWRLGGWDGTAPADSPRRLLDMAQVEQSAMGDIPPGEAERLSAVLASLATERTPIESVLLVDPLESFPWLGARSWPACLTSRNGSLSRKVMVSFGCCRSMRSRRCAESRSKPWKAQLLTVAWFSSRYRLARPPSTG